MTLFYIALLLIVSISSAFSINCPALPQFLGVNETDSDIIIMNVTSYPSITWTMDIKKAGPLTLSATQKDLMGRYLKLTKTNTTLYLNVTQPLDLQALKIHLNVIVTSVVIDINCQPASGPITPNTLTINVKPVNQFPPVFENSPYTIIVPEDTPVSAVVFNNYTVTDTDVGQTGQLIYNITAYDVTEQDGSKYFGIPQSTKKDVVLLKAVDYDHLKATQGRDFFVVTMFVTDENGEGKSTKTTLKINIKNVDDQPPAFVFPDCGTQCTPRSYRVQTSPSYRGSLKIQPGNVRAVDLDNLTTDILYSIEKGGSKYDDSFMINRHTGEISQIDDVLETSVIIIKAEENMPNHHFAIIPLLVSLASPNITFTKSPAASKKESGNGMQTALIVLGVVAVLIIAVFVVLFLVYWNRHRKLVNVTPADIRPPSPATSEEVLPTDKSEKSESKTDLLDAAFYPTPEGKNNRLPPVQKVDMSTETNTTKKRSRRRKKLKEPEIFDGTREYEKEADSEFFDAADKSKIKRSTRNIKENQKDPKYWITVPNEEQE